MKMTYEEAKAHRQRLEEANKNHAAAVREFDKYGKSPMGLTPDHVRAMPEWKTAKTAVDLSFAELQAFNAWFVKTFKNEYAADRRR